MRSQPQPQAAPDVLGDLVAAVKPRLRGWLHAGTFPLALAAGIVLSVLAPAGAPRVGAVVFTVTAALLFGTSAVYHRGHWSGRVAGVLKRLDHANIFLIIAGTYTPFARAQRRLPSSMTPTCRGTASGGICLASRRSYAP